ncbi:hypothetical protein PROFUN_04731 [Planoprotostelium fungivorum]|uniref:Homeobox domain-containing protein n=1 Tax=Planoprotostelium fungivorum TaxID=1890364 RepID=A0A2P6NFY4_9EUKA|nr:hypothetical protein PROFUN_04731 [Planoprotostelium fungivorum]
MPEWLWTVHTVKEKGEQKVAEDTVTIIEPSPYVSTCERVAQDCREKVAIHRLLQQPEEEQCIPDWFKSKKRKVQSESPMEDAVHETLMQWSEVSRQNMPMVDKWDFPLQRRTFAPEVVDMLEASFTEGKKWTQIERQQLINMTGLTREQLQKWRDNRKRVGPPKKTRSYLTDAQYERLLEVYHHDGRMSIPLEEREQLSTELGISREKLRLWIKSHSSRGEVTRKRKNVYSCKTEQK